jgi:hypothetical protein
MNKSINDIKGPKWSYIFEKKINEDSKSSLIFLLLKN